MKKQNETVTEFYGRKNELKKMINKHFGLYKVLATIGEAAEADDEDLKWVVGTTAMLEFIEKLDGDNDEQNKWFECLILTGFISLLEECGVFDDDEDEDRPRIKVFQTSDKKMFKKLTKMMEDEMEGENE